MCSRSFNIIDEEQIVAKDVPEDKVMLFVTALLDNGHHTVTISEYIEPERR